MAKDTIARALAIKAMDSSSLTPYSAGNGLEISDGTINVKYDDETIGRNQSNELEIKSQGFASSILGYDETKNQVLRNNNGTLFWEDVEVYTSLSN